MELSALLTMLAELAGDAKDQARIDFPGTQADAVTMGIAFLHEHIRVSFQDAEDFDLTTQTEAEVLQGALGDFCREQCHHSREAEPGAADACPGCHLMPFTSGAIEEVVSRAMASTVSSPRHAAAGVFDPAVVVAARARMDAEFDE